MVNVGYFQDDNVIIPDDIKNMTKEERRKEIAFLEEEAKKRKNSIKQSRNLKAV